MERFALGAVAALGLAAAAPAVAQALTGAGYGSPRSAGPPALLVCAVSTRFPFSLGSLTHGFSSF